MQLEAQLFLDRYAWCEQTLRRLLSPGQSVVDIGCAHARWKTLIEGELHGHWHGYDLTPQDPSVRRWDLDQPCPEPDLSFDAVLLLDVLEHLNNPGLGLRHALQLLRPGGVLLLTVPNPGWSRSRWELLRTGTLTCFTRQDLELNHHVFTPWPHLVEYLLSQNGLKPVSYVTLDGKTTWPDRITLRYPLRLLSSLFNQWIERRDPSACGMSYAVLARKG